MRLDNTRTSGRIRTRRGLALLIASGTALGSLLLATTPAQANDTTKQVAVDGQSITFATSDSSRGVSGNVSFVVNAAGNWQITGTGKNSHLLVRTFHWTCDLTWDAASVSHATGKKAVPGKKTRTISSAAYDPNVQADFADIVARGRADCDIVIG
ncbi:MULTISPECIES: hypothetical protein [Streptomyces]|uniref:Secreted protein n=1 Tax=Streptomyces europaeiscabiei TaxID=146819 RepID=A0ABU4NSG7_9ACTN|nr:MULTISPECIES: hypothetical protein [Streptomyces]MDX2528222.1 hypothetical protein [Streptomyces europaeiscabiei]MDX2553346.1 hypothetical protein [Streptomyces stelliscabiei]MDX2612382.1 hypothetical protein [Streptomyces stelliscabiei]MDX2637744.1 hypothetical protein [Streptomyces stelliscabiei]MDX2659203.1 hypothetical protein [Streptomyces stelliscabiei]